MTNLVNTIAIDWESFYSTEFSLSKITTQQYVLSEHFEAIGVSVKLNDQPTLWCSGPHEEIHEWLQQFPWDDATVIAHNAIFDGAILEWRFGIRPARWHCTMQASRPLYVPWTPNGKMSLATISKYLGLPPKGTEVMRALGLRRRDFSPQQLARYGEYCKHDTELAYLIYQDQKDQLPQTELDLVDATIKKYTRPRFELDLNILTQRLAEVRAEKEEVLAKAFLVDNAVLMSNPQFAEALEALGVVPPMKISPRTGKQTFAFAKNDPEFKDLLEHEDSRVQALVAARLKHKSTQEETRLVRFIQVEATKHPFAVPLLYCGAHTGRFSGLDKLNCLLPDTEVLTPQGWVTLDALGPGIPVMQWATDGTLSWAVPFILRKDYSGQIIEYGQTCHTLAYTEDHRIPVLVYGGDEWKDSTAEELVAAKKDYKIPNAGLYGAAGMFPSEAMARVFAAIRADGHVSQKCGIGFKIKKPRKQNRLQSLLHAAGIRFSIKRYSDGYLSFHLYKESTKWLLSHTAQHGKQYGPWVLQLSSAEIQCLLDEEAHWDATLRNRSYLWFSANDTEAEWMQTLSHLGGRSMNYTKRNNARGYGVGGDWTINVGNVKPRDYFVQEVKRKPKTYQYDGEVMCLGVPSTYFLARRKGVIQVTGNCQNLQRGGALRRALKAPPGHKVVAGDLSQIEARITATLAGQSLLINAFRAGKDVYSMFATQVFGYEVNKIDHPTERFVGKTCFAADTQVLTRRGWVPIINVLDTDKLWDGVEWISHAGVITVGEKETLTHQGITATPDHEILVGDTWVEWTEVQENATLFRAALNSVNLPSSGMCSTPPKQARHGATGPSVVAHVAQRTLSTLATCVRDALHGVTNAPRLQPALSGIGNTAMPCPTMRTARGYSTAFHPALAAVTTPKTESTVTMGSVASQCHNSGAMTDQRSFGMHKHSLGGMTLPSSWIAPITTQGTPPETSASPPGGKTYKTGEKSTNYRRKTTVYDICYAGPRTRFCVLSESGPLIAHNCILGLGYQVGAEKLKATLKAGGIEVTLEEANRYVQTYRKTYSKIRKLWYTAETMIRYMAAGETLALGPVKTIKNGILLPNGMRLNYPDLQRDGTGQWTYTYRGKKAYLYGGKLCIAAGTDVLTDSGWKPIETVTMDDRVYDGVEFVTHGGILYNGDKPTIKVDGVRMTPDHEVFTDAGWQEASQLQRPDRPNLRYVDRDPAFAQQWQEMVLGVSMPLRQRSDKSGWRRNKRGQAGWHPKLRVQDVGASVRAQDPRYEQASCLRRLALHEGSLSFTFASGVAQLRGAGHHSMQALAGFFRELLGGHEIDVPAWANAGSGGQQRKLHSSELPVGQLPGAGCEPTKQYACRHAQGARGNGNQHVNSSLSLETRAVYDITNAGPRQRFVVRGNEGPFIVHNCENIVQALARIVVSTAEVYLYRRGWLSQLQAHDELVYIVLESLVEKFCKVLEAVLTRPVEWMPDLPVAAEVSYGDNYAEAK